MIRIQNYLRLFKLKVENSLKRIKNSDEYLSLQQKINFIDMFY